MFDQRARFILSLHSVVFALLEETFDRK